MTIRVISLDYDGCLSREGASADDYGWVITQNQVFLDNLRVKNDDFKKTVVLVGSNRQSHGSDSSNHKKKLKGSRIEPPYESGHIFPAIQKVSAYLEATLDKFLLADIYGNVPSGTSFDRAVNNPDGAHADWTFDHTKVTVLYAQMHKLAMEHPQEEIIFDFYDDREDVRNKIFNFCTKYPQFVPKNLTLNLHHYAGKECQIEQSIKGTGLIDVCYRQSVKELAMVNLSSEFQMGGEIHVWGTGDNIELDLNNFAKNCEVRIKAKKYLPLKIGLLGGGVVGGLATGAHFLAAETLKTILTAVCLSSVNPFLAIAILAVVTAILIGIAAKMFLDRNQNRLENI